MAMSDFGDSCSIEVSITYRSRHDRKKQVSANQYRAGGGDVSPTSAVVGSAVTA